ncbi:hypothetical protein [Thalassospira xiamenensis]|uniref:nicotinate phosphoribosyltransferase n=1 Tax=Thalassospira xiamenensis TaxID=220697 RepID=A0A285TSC1_9PROT|nr:hypothetical protein [Thalassospira xiamenensis]SOC26759.1 nicotinate phosphoribosyltransferase [Thalassospira xiamenensis]
MLINFPNRAHNANFRFDPIVRSLLDTDFYKLLMLQFIWKYYPDVHAEFSLINRTKSVKLAEIIDERELRDQLEAVRNLKFKRTELVWLAGETFYGQRSIFEPEFIQWLGDFQLPGFTLSKDDDGQYDLTFCGTWAETTMWEIYAVSIVNELRNRAGLASMSEFELDMLYAKGKSKLWDKISRLNKLDGLKIADFSTRRRHSFLWQEYCVNALTANLGTGFVGTSNAYIAFKHNLEAVGTNAHELPMVLTALSDLIKQVVSKEKDKEKAGILLDGFAVQFCDIVAKQSFLKAQYAVLAQWSVLYGQAMRVMLPDTYGSSQFYRNAPEFVTDFTGVRIDSKDPFVAGAEYISWLAGKGKTAIDKLLLFSDGLDVNNIEDLHNEFSGRARVSFGWGTLCSNDFRDCHPQGSRALDPINLVCKVTTVGFEHEDKMCWTGAVKLSDNFDKATGSPKKIEDYRTVFGTEGVANVPQNF